jgi:hypothetical protein
MRKLTLERLPDYDLLDERPLTAILNAGQRLLEQVCGTSAEAEGSSWNLRESVWPALHAHNADDGGTPEVKPRLVLLPLSRIGSEGGFSGSKIFLGYFSDVGAGRIFPSLPLVIKFAEIQEGESRKLFEEKNLADTVRPFLAYHKDAFAVPLFLDENDGYDVLWSPFALTEMVEWQTEASRLSLSALDFRQLLKEQSPGTNAVKELIQAVYKILRPLHRRARPVQREQRTYREEYERYLRRFPDKWGAKWVAAWGDSEYMTDLGGETFHNPIWVLNRLLEARAITMLTGAVHGDLHPGNIMFSQVGAPSVIDFGWATSNSHVAKDFVLLECNLRFTYLHADTALNDVVTLSEWVGNTTECGHLSDAEANQAYDAIKAIRSSFEQLGDEATDWDLEYVVPLFIVAFGLLRFLDENWNQISARHTVLKLARYVAINVLPKLQDPAPATNETPTELGS